jgi:hypothetical protein
MTNTEGKFLYQVWQIQNRTDTDGSRDTIIQQFCVEESLVFSLFYERTSVNGTGLFAKD